MGIGIIGAHKLLNVLIICLSSDSFVVKDLRMRRSLVNLSELVKSVTKMVTGCLSMTKVDIFVVYELKGLLLKFEKYWTYPKQLYYINFGFKR